MSIKRLYKATVKGDGLVYETYRSTSFFRLLLKMYFDMASTWLTNSDLNDGNNFIKIELESQCQRCKNFVKVP